MFPIKNDNTNRLTDGQEKMPHLQQLANLESAEKRDLNMKHDTQNVNQSFNKKENAENVDQENNGKISSKQIGESQIDPQMKNKHNEQEESEISDNDIENQDNVSSKSDRKNNLQMAVIPTRNGVLSDELV